MHSIDVPWKCYCYTNIDEKIQQRHYILKTVGEKLLIKSQGLLHLILVSKYCFYSRYVHTKIYPSL